MDSGGRGGGIAGRRQDCRRGTRGRVRYVAQADGQTPETIVSGIIPGVGAAVHFWASILSKGFAIECHDCRRGTRGRVRHIAIGALMGAKSEPCLHL